MNINGASGVSAITLDQACLQELVFLRSDSVISSLHGFYP